VSYYKDLTEVPNTGGEVYIHRLENSTKGTWYVRIKRLNANGYFRKSLRTTDIFAAFTKANRYWIQVREAEEQHVVLAPRNNFASLAKEWIEERRRISTNEVATKTIWYQFRNYYIPYFASYNVGTITEKSYITFLNKHRLIKEKCPMMRKRPTIRTLEVEQQNLRSFMNWCFQNGKMRVRMDMRSVSRNEYWIENKNLVDYDKPQRRDIVSTEVYDSWRRFLRSTKVTTQRVRNGKPYAIREPSHNKMSRRRMHFYMLTVYNLVCRPGVEVLKLKFNDFKAQESKIQTGSYFMTMTTRYGKKVARRKAHSPRELVYHSDYNYFGYFKTWVEFLQENGYPTGPDDYVFPVRKRMSRYRQYKSYARSEGELYKEYDSGSACAYLYRMKEPLREWCRKNNRLTPKLDEEIEQFSMYSVRHIAIRNLIVESGYDFSRVAERANTGLTMVQDFYYKYGLKAEDRIVARHPEPAAINTERYNDDDVDVMAGVIDILPSRK